MRKREKESLPKNDDQPGTLKEKDFAAAVAFTRVENQPKKYPKVSQISPAFLHAIFHQCDFLPFFFDVFHVSFV